MGALH